MLLHILFSIFNLHVSYFSDSRGSRRYSSLQCSLKYWVYLQFTSPRETKSLFTHCLLGVLVLHNWTLHCLSPPDRCGCRSVNMAMCVFLALGGMNLYPKKIWASDHACETVNCIKEETVPHTAAKIIQLNEARGMKRIRSSVWV